MKEQQDGTWEETTADLDIAGAAVTGLTGGPEGALLNGGGTAITKIPQLLDAKGKELKGDWDGISATGKFIGARLNDMSKSNSHPTRPRSERGK
jgi:hypothetical protein